MGGREFGDGKLSGTPVLVDREYCVRERGFCKKGEGKAAKARVINLTKTMAKELAPYINVNTVAPGHTLTEMTAPLPDAVKKNMIEGSNLKRMGRPEDIANAILFLASDEANFFTGQLLLPDGGFSLK